MQVTERAQNLVTAITAEVPAYRGLDPETAADVLEANRLTIRAFDRMISKRKAPSEKDLEALADSAARRVHQGIPLESVLRAFRIGAWMMWRDASKTAPPSDLPPLTELAFEYIDRVSTLSERAFLRAREEQWTSRASLATVFLSRLATRDPMETGEVVTYLRGLGLDPAANYVGVLARPHLPSDDYAGQLSRDFLPKMRRQLADNGILAPLRTGVYGLVRAEALTVVLDGFAEVLKRDDHPNLVLGVGRAHPDTSSGCRHTLEEAQRAVDLGLRLDAETAIHAYEDLALLDMFRDTWLIDHFIDEQIGALIGDAGQAQLLETLREFLAAQGQRKIAARQLGVHPNTIDYRLRKIEQILDGPIRGERQFLIQLAIRLVPLTGHSAGRTES